MPRVAIVDYGLCNLDSVKRAVEECGSSAIISSSPRDIQTATHIILPGVGAFGDAMRNLHQNCLDQALNEQVLGNQIPFLGICLGMQLMATVGYEEGETPGLGWIEGEVIRFTPDEPSTRIPHVGWNEIDAKYDSALLKGVADGSDVYFVHSYHLHPLNENEVVASTPYCGGFVSVVQKEHIYGVQFHPEKSQKVGFKILKNFLVM